jgi:hypothetical protein
MTATGGQKQPIVPLGDALVPPVRIGDRKKEVLQDGQASASGAGFYKVLYLSLGDGGVLLKEQQHQ